MKISMKFHVSLKEIAHLQEEDVYGSSMGSREKMENVLESLSVFWFKLSSNSLQKLGKLSAASARLYQSRFLQAKAYSSAIFILNKTYTPSHLSKLR